MIYFFNQSSILLSFYIGIVGVWVDRHGLCRVSLYLLNPTSNHNLESDFVETMTVVYLLIPTSNHNKRTFGYAPRYVVYLLIPTSNHNVAAA